MGNRKDIGKIFNEKFKDFEQAPGADLWDTIASELDQKRDRKIAPLWLYFGGFIIVGLLTGLLYWEPWNTSNSPNVTEQPLIVKTDAISQDDTIDIPSNKKESTTIITGSEIKNGADSEITTITDITTNTNTTSSKNSTITNTASTLSGTSNESSTFKNLISDKSQEAVVTTKKTNDSYNREKSSSLQNQTTPSPSIDKNNKATSIKAILSTMVSASQKLRDQKELEARTAYEAKIKEELATAIATQREENKVALQKWQDSIQLVEISKKTALAIAAKTEKKSETKKVPKLPKTDEERENDRKESINYKFAISPYTSLLSYGSLTKGSSIDNRLVDNPRDAIGTTGYGIRAEYTLSERSSIRFGIGVAPLQYKTEDFQVLITNNNVNIFQLSGIDPQNLNQTGGIQPSPEALAFFNSNDVVSIEQNISYIEVPVDYQYRFLNKRVSMSFNTGLSLFVLTNNRVFATADSGQSIFIGRETSLKDLSLALNLGLGTYYNFSKKWRFDVEPAFKYQLNPYSDNIGNFKPYYFGLQFGMSYKF